MTDQRCFRSRFAWLAPAFTAVVFAAGLFGADRFEQIFAGLLAMMSGGAAARLMRVRICRAGGEYLIVNLLRTYRVATADVCDVTTPRLLGGLWFPWTRLLLVDGRHLWVTALPGEAKSRSLAAFLEDFAQVRPLVVQRDASSSQDARLLEESSLPPGRRRQRGWRSWSTRRRTAFIAWGVGEAVALVIVVILGPKTLPAIMVVVAAVWVPCLVLILLGRGREARRRRLSR